jgi:hypothetical protein
MIDDKLPIVDKDAYENYQSIQRQLDGLDSEYVDEKSGATYFLAGNVNTLQRQIAHLDSDTRERLIAVAQLIKSLTAQRTHFKRRAYGIKKGEQAGSDPIMQYRDKIVEMFGQFHSVEEVYKTIVTEWKLPCQRSTLEYIRRADGTEIRALQDAHQKDFSSVRLAHKKSRLLELAMLYQSRKIIYDRTQNKDDYNLLLRTLEQLRKEVEGDKLFIEGAIDLNIQATIDIHIKNEITSNLAIMDVIISRVAAKTNTNPLLILSKLHNSIYAKFTGFGNATRQEMIDGDIQDIGLLSYDFDAIKKRIAIQQQQLDVNGRQDQMPIIIAPKELSRVQSIKEMLAAKIAAMRNDADTAGDNMVK